MAVDAKHKLIAAADGTNDVTDINQLATMALLAKANLDLKQTEVVADAGYYNAGEVSRCVEQNVSTVHSQGGHQREHGTQGCMAKADLSLMRTKMCMCARQVESLSYRFSTYSWDAGS